jgi:hypothetical protein
MSAHWPVKLSYPIKGDVKRKISFLPSAGGMDVLGGIQPLSSWRGLVLVCLWPCRAFQRRGQPTRLLKPFITRNVADALSSVMLRKLKCWLKSANHDPIGDSMPIAFLDYAEGA